MHLKNFSLYENVDYQLTPAYDLLSTALVMPEDKEELALTLNGKKNKLNRKDFETSCQSSGLELKVVENIFAKFQKTIPEWNSLIESSFLSEEMKNRYKKIIQERKERIL